MSSRLQIQATPISVWKTVQQNWRNPMAIAAIASLGIHGLLFWGLPRLPMSAFDTQEPEAAKSVDLVQLTPEEQNRLPDFSDEQVQLPSIARSATPLPKTSLPNPSSSNPDSFFSNPLPPPPSNSFSNPLPTWVPPTTLWIPPAATDWQPPTATKPAAPQQRAQPQQQQQQQQRTQPQQRQQQPANPTSRTLTSDELKSIEKDLNSTASPNQIASNSAATPRTLDNIRQDLRDRILARRQQIAEQQTQEALLAPDATGTAEGEPRNRYAAWFEQATNWLGKDYTGKNAERIKLDHVPYPTAACQKQLSGTAIVGVVVDPQGKVVTDPIPPAILQGAGYRILNQQAAAAAAAHQFAATGKKSAYQVEVQFQYDPGACSAAPRPPAQTGG